MGFPYITFGICTCSNAVFLSTNCSKTPCLASTLNKTTKLTRHLRPGILIMYSIKLASDSLIGQLC